MIFVWFVCLFVVLTLSSESGDNLCLRRIEVGIRADAELEKRVEMKVK